MVPFPIVKYSFNIDGKLSEQRVYWKIQAHLAYLPTQIHAVLQVIYGNNALRYATVCKWLSHLRDGWETIENDLQQDRPVFLLMEMLIP